MSDNVERNMYGCTACPTCQSQYRVPYHYQHGVNKGIREIVCDDCGFREPWDSFLIAKLREGEG